MSKNKRDDSLATGDGLKLFGQVVAAGYDRLVGRRLGDYRVVELIAEGGMSRIYRAERSDGSFERDVAIKVSALSGINERFIERFRREQGLLAGLNHPGISQLFDVGVTEEGWPYIVMELIDCQPIHRYCEQQALDVRDRLGLLIGVVDAVAYAHARLIVHRDIKPSNVLVDDAGRPRLLDFGIARLLGGEDDPATREQLMTPAYASPEQLLGQPVTVASDIYQLGALIFETLTGTPMTPDVVLAEAIQRAAQGQPILLDAKARARLPRELALVVEHCVRADPGDRYRDANALREDLEAFLEGYPVRAAGQSPAYRLRKFVRRNRVAVSIAVVAAMAVVTSTVWYTLEITHQRDEARSQKRLADESLRFVVSFFQASDPDTAQGRELTAAEILAQGAERVERELADQPQIQQRLFFEVAASQYQRGDLASAERQIRKAMQATERIDDVDPLDRLTHLNLLGNILGEQGRLEESLELLRQVYTEAPAALGPDHRLTLGAQNNLAIAYYELGRLEEALPLYEDVYRKKMRLFGPEDRSTLATATNLMALYGPLDRIDEQIELGTVGLDRAERALGRNHPQTLDFLGNLANGLLVRDGAEAALPLMQDVVDRSRETFGEDDFRYLDRVAQLGALYADAGDPVRGEAMQRSVIDAMAAIRGADHPQVMHRRAAYAATLAKLDEIEAARAELVPLLSLQNHTLGPDHPDVVYSRLTYADILVRAADPSARSYCEELVSDLQALYGDDHRHVRKAMEMLAATRT